MSKQTAPDVERVVRAVEDIVQHAVDLADDIAAAVRPVLEVESEPSRGHLSVVESVVAPVLSDLDQPVQGAGFVAAVGLLADATWWLEWFARDADARIQRLATHSDPQEIGFYDYESLPWYVVPRDAGRRHVTGPYVDYLCTEEYTLTFSTPVAVAGRFVGIAGADIAVKRVERHLLPALCAADRRVAVVNGEGRILSSNSGRHLCGDLLSEADGERMQVAHALQGLPLSVVLLSD